MGIVIRSNNIHKPKNCKNCRCNDDDCFCYITKGYIDRDDFSCSIPCPIEELEDTWIPVHNPETELPKDKMIWVTICTDGFTDWYYDVETRWYDMTEWNESVKDVVAYMPYHDMTPKPYGVEEE